MLQDIEQSFSLLSSVDCATNRNTHLTEIQLILEFSLDLSFVNDNFQTNLEEFGEI